MLLQPCRCNIPLQLCLISWLHQSYLLSKMHHTALTHVGRTAGCQSGPVLTLKWRPPPPCCSPDGWHRQAPLLVSAACLQVQGQHAQHTEVFSTFLFRAGQGVRHCAMQACGAWMLQQAVWQVLSNSTPTTLALLSRQLQYSAVHRVTEVQLTADSSTASPAA
jgi:hypothetical protein